MPSESARPILLPFDGSEDAGGAIASELAQEKAARGVERATQSGFSAPTTLAGG
jgi:hypothetical protein